MLQIRREVRDNLLEILRSPVSKTFGYVVQACSPHG
jgi:hypothetical protein